MVSAPPKQMPMVMRTAPGLSLDREPPMVKISTMAAPTYIPASRERTRWLGKDRRCAASLAAAWSPRVRTASVYMMAPHVLCAHADRGVCRTSAHTQRYRFQQEPITRESTVTKRLQRPRRGAGGRGGQALIKL